MKSMNDLLLTYAQDMYYAERQILKALPKMARASENEELKRALIQHRDETQGHVERLQEFEQGAVRDTGILASAQAVEHYEIARYGTMIAWAKACGMNDAARVLQETLDEEKKADELLNQIANKSLNKAAAQKAA
jgi:ferritin-like metal-binding protein YciE